MSSFDISEKNAVINYAIQTNRIAGLLEKSETEELELEDYEIKLFQLAAEFVNNLIIGAQFTFEFDKMDELEITFISIRDFRISYPVFDKLKWKDEKNTIIHNLKTVENCLNEIRNSNSIPNHKSEDFITLKEFYNSLSDIMHEEMLANKLDTIENYSSRFWPEGL